MDQHPLDGTTPEIGPQMTITHHGPPPKRGVTGVALLLRTLPICCHAGALFLLCTCESS